MVIWGVRQQVKMADDSQPILFSLLLFISNLAIYSLYQSTYLPCILSVCLSIYRVMVEEEVHFVPVWPERVPTFGLITSFLHPNSKKKLKRIILQSRISAKIALNAESISFNGISFCTNNTKQPNTCAHDFIHTGSLRVLISKLEKLV